MAEHALILGAGSTIAAALAERLAADGTHLHLAARDRADVERLAANLRVRHGVEVTTGAFEATDYAAHAQLITDAVANLGGIDLAILAFGSLGDEERAQREFEEALRIIDLNFVAAVSVLTALVPILEGQGSGIIVALTSVAGDRGRRSNYVYGSAKGALTLYLSGLRARLTTSGVRVVTAKLGFVDTKMTFGRRGMFMVARPEKVASALVADIRAGRDVVYRPRFWRLVMLLIRALPERVFKRLPL